MNPSLDELSTQGAKLLSNRDNPENACKNLNSWIELVGRHLASNYPDSGLLAEWLAIGNISHNSQYPL